MAEERGAGLSWVELAVVYKSVRRSVLSSEIEEASGRRSGLCGPI